MSKEITVEKNVDVDVEVVENPSEEEREVKKKVIITPKKLIKIAVGVGAAVAGIAFAKSVNKRQTELESDINDVKVKNAENTLRLDMLENENTSAEETEELEGIDEIELEEL